MFTAVAVEKFSHERSDDNNFHGSKGKVLLMTAANFALSCMLDSDSVGKLMVLACLQAAVSMGTHEIGCAEEKKAEAPRPRRS